VRRIPVYLIEPMDKTDNKLGSDRFYQY